MTQQAPTSLSEEERLLIDGHMIALLVTAFHDDGMDGRRVQRLALLADVRQHAAHWLADRQINGENIQNQTFP